VIDGSSAIEPSHDETILVVEDDDMVRRVSVRRLVDLGYRVIEASDGKSALAHIDGGAEFDLLFTDLVMPGGMTGIDLAREARARRPDLPVLYTSGYADPNMVKGGMLRERAEWLSKPYGTDALSLKLRRLLDR
jgi:CheY-like chemotaxis protein